MNLARHIMLSNIERYDNMGVFTLFRKLELVLENHLKAEWVQGKDNKANCIYSRLNSDMPLIECQWGSIAKKIVDDHNLVLTMKETHAK